MVQLAIVKSAHNLSKRVYYWYVAYKKTKGKGGELELLRSSGLELELVCSIVGDTTGNNTLCTS